MTRDDIARMARESTLMIDFKKNGFPHFPALEEFVSLVAAAEREACALLIEQMGIEEYGTLAIAAAVRARGNS